MSVATARASPVRPARRRAHPPAPRLALNPVPFLWLIIGLTMVVPAWFVAGASWHEVARRASPGALAHVAQSHARFVFSGRIPMIGGMARRLHRG